MHVWVACDNAPELGGDFIPRLSGTLATISRNGFGAACRLTVDQAPPELRHHVLYYPEVVTAAAIAERNEEVFLADKLVLVSIQADWSGVSLTLRQLDCRTRQWSAPWTRSIQQTSRVEIEAAYGLLETFSALGRIDKVETGEALVRMRANLLMEDEHPFINLNSGALLRPVSRRNDRFGNPISGGVRTLPWTVLQVSGPADGGYKCKVHSGVSQPLRARRSRNLEQLALAIRTPYPETRLRLVAGSQGDGVLSGCEIHTRDPEDTGIKLLGRADWRGELDIGSTAGKLRVLYVKNGNEVLARLPMVPGESASLTAVLPDDSQRLEAEGFLSGMQGRLVDLVAMDSVLSARVRTALNAGRTDVAETLFDRLVELESREDLMRQLRNQRRNYSTEDRRVRRKIDRLFDEARRRIQSSTMPVDIDVLRQEIARLRGGTPS